jgi:hypothetical protein
MILSEVKEIVKKRIKDLRNQYNTLNYEQQEILGDLFEGRIYELKYLLNLLDNKPQRTILSKSLANINKTQYKENKKR